MKIMRMLIRRKPILAITAREKGNTRFNMPKKRGGRGEHG